MTLADLIIQNGWQTKTAEELVELANTKSIEWRDPERWTFGGFAELIGLDKAEQALELLRGPFAKPNTAATLTAGGLPISDASGLALLDALAASIPEVATIKAAVYRLESPAEAAGLAAVTLADAEAALAALALDAQRQQLIADGAAAWNSFIDAVSAWDGSGPAPVLGG